MFKIVAHGGLYSWRHYEESAALAWELIKSYVVRGCRVSVKFIPIKKI